MEIYLKTYESNLDDEQCHIFEKAAKAIYIFSALIHSRRANGELEPLWQPLSARV